MTQEQGKPGTGVTVPALGGLAGNALEQGKTAMKTQSDNAEVFLLMNSRDETQIMKELMGVFAKEYVYRIPFMSGNETTYAEGLSWAGIKEARRLYGGIDVDIIEGPDLHGDPSDSNSFYTCKARAKDLRTGNATTAAYRQRLWGKRRGGGFYEIEFAFEFAQSKAKRNAIAELLPQPLVKAWLADAREGKTDFDPRRVRELEEGKDFSVSENKGGGKSSPPPQGRGQGGGGRGRGRQANGGGGRGRGKRGDGGGPPMSAPQFGMIHKLVKEKGVNYPSFMMDENGEPYRDFEDFPDEKKVPVGKASEIISALLADNYVEDEAPDSNGQATTEEPSPPSEAEGREPGEDGDEFALE